MIHDRIQFHNAAELVAADDGLLLQRVPEAVRRELEDGGRMRARQAANTELRFVAEGPVRVTLSAPGGPVAVCEYRGDLQVFARHEIGRERTTVTVNREFPGLPEAVDHPALRGAFHPRVVRLAAGGALPASRLIYHGAEGARRPPRPAELPSRTLLAYGTSITQGFNASYPYLAWPAVTARELGWDVVNLGMGGACMCERAMADHIAGRDDWDLAVLPLSVNMCERPYDEFTERVGYLLRTVAARRPENPIVAITLFPFFRDLGVNCFADTSAVGDPEVYRRILRELAGGIERDGVHLLEGPHILTRCTDLAVDLIHPSDHGLVNIGLNVARRLRELGVAAGAR